MCKDDVLEQMVEYDVAVNNGRWFFGGSDEEDQDGSEEEDQE